MMLGDDYVEDESYFMRDECIAPSMKSQRWSGKVDILGY